jgi:uncharacterized protein (TIGR04206 family)
MINGARRRFLLVLAVGVIPWTVVSTRGITTLLHPIGLLNFTPPHLVFLPEYVFVYTRGLPDYILAWPIGVLVYLLALASAAGGLVGREDRRLTAGLLALVALTQLSVAAGFSRRLNYVAVPVVTITAVAVAWHVRYGDSGDGHTAGRKS